MPKGRKFIQYSEQDIAMLSDPLMSSAELAHLLKIGIATVVRARKRLGIKIPLGGKKDKPRPGKVKKETRICAHPNCSNTFVVVPSKIRSYCSHSCHSKSIIPYKRTPKTIAKISKPDTPAYTAYKRKVHRISSKVYNENINVINPERHPRTLCGIEGGWQLDHIISIRECFITGVPAEKAASLENLRVLPWRDNLMRYYVNRS